VSCFISVALDSSLSFAANTDIAVTVMSTAALDVNKIAEATTVAVTTTAATTVAVTTTAANLSSPRGTVHSLIHQKEAAFQDLVELSVPQLVVMELLRWVQAILLVEVLCANTKVPLVDRVGL